MYTAPVPHVVGSDTHVNKEERQEQTPLILPEPMVPRAQVLKVYAHLAHPVRLAGSKAGHPLELQDGYAKQAELKAALTPERSTPRVTPREEAVLVMQVFKEERQSQGVDGLEVMHLVKSEEHKANPVGGGQ